MRILSACTAVLCCVLAVWRLWAAEISPPPADRATERKSSDASATGVAESVDRLMGEMEQLDRKIHELESRVENDSGRLARLDEERRRIKGRLASLRQGPGNAEARMVVLYKYRLMGYVTSMLSASGVPSVVESGNLAANLLENDHRLFLELQNRVAEVQRLGAEIAGKDREADELRNQLNAWSREIASAKTTKLGLLAGINRRDDLYSRYSAKLEENKKTLENRAFSRKPVFDSRERPFSSRQGALPVPAAGEFIETFNSKMDAGSRSILYNNGIIIMAGKGQPIRAIHEGVVMFADWFKEYGKVMIIDHGEHYYSLIAHAEQFLKNTGDVVKSGETIATVGNTGSPTEPKLYFEIRHYGKPVDPKEWLALQ